MVSHILLVLSFEIFPNAEGKKSNLFWSFQNSTFLQLHLKYLKENMTKSKMGAKNVQIFQNI